MKKFDTVVNADGSKLEFKSEDEYKQYVHAQFENLYSDREKGFSLEEQKAIEVHLNKHGWSTMYPLSDSDSLKVENDIADALGKARYEIMKPKADPFEDVKRWEAKIDEGLVESDRIMKAVREMSR